MVVGKGCGVIEGLRFIICDRERESSAILSDQKSSFELLFRREY